MADPLLHEVYDALVARVGGALDYDVRWQPNEYEPDGFVEQVRPLELTNLSETANQAGAVTAQDFAIFHDHGYMGLYGGLRAQDIHRRKELKKGQQILDHMGSTELAANLFRATQTEEKLRREQIAT